MPDTAITRLSLTTQVRGAVRAQILDGRLAPGARINESQIATQLGVSRTPLREALAGLARDGFLLTEPGRGYSVSPLTPEEANELYPILGVLEATAVRLAGAPDAEDRAALEELNRRLRAVGESPDAAINANFAWHERLIARCRNQRLVTLVRTLWTQVRRYEYAFYAPGAARVRLSATLHDGIIAALAANDLDRAAALVQDHWLTDLDRLMPRMREGESSAGGSASPPA